MEDDIIIVGDEKVWGSRKKRHLSSCEIHKKGGEIIGKKIGSF